MSNTSTSKWVFPPPGNASNLPSSSLNLNYNTTVLQYLNTSALYAPPRNGSFGEARTYKRDTIVLSWRSVPTGDVDVDRIARKRTMYCMPSRAQPSTAMDGFETRFQNYYYSPTESMPTLYAHPLRVNPGISISSNSTPSISYLLYLPEYNIPNMSESSFLCTISLGEEAARDFSTPFEYFNLPRNWAEAGRSYLFNGAAPLGVAKNESTSEGGSYGGQTRHVNESLSGGKIAGIVVACVVAAVLVLVGGVVCVRRKRNAVGSARDDEGLYAVGERVQGYESGDVELPQYGKEPLPHEGPPAYSVAVKEGGKGKD